MFLWLTAPFFASLVGAFSRFALFLRAWRFRFLPLRGSHFFRSKHDFLDRNTSLDAFIIIRQNQIDLRGSLMLIKSHHEWEEPTQGHYFFSFSHASFGYSSTLGANHFFFLLCVLCILQQTSMQTFLFFFGASCGYFNKLRCKPCFLNMGHPAFFLNIGQLAQKLWKVNTPMLFDTYTPLPRFGTLQA